MSVVLDIENHSHVDDFFYTENSGSKFVERPYESIFPFQKITHFIHLDKYRKLKDLPLEINISSVFFKVDWGEWSKSKLVGETLERKEPELLYNIPVKLEPVKKTKITFNIINKKKGKFRFQKIW